MELRERFAAALVFASEKHARQRRKGTDIPYIEHLLGVTSTVLAYGGDEDAAIAALLHDVVEDQGGAAARAEILARFGPRVTAIVDGCTDTDQTPKPPWRARKEAYLAHLPAAAADVLLVSAADKLHNARSIIRGYRAVGEVVWDRFTTGKAGTLWWYESLVAAFLAAPAAQTPPLRWLVEEFAATVGELRALVGAEPAASMSSASVSNEAAR